MKLIGIGIIGYFNFIGTILNVSIQEVKPKGKNPIQFLQKKHKTNMIERHIGLAIQTWNN